MRFINKTKNSVQLEDINLNIPYIDGQEQSIDTDSVKKSLALQKMVSLGAFFVTEASSDRIEQNLLRTSLSFVDKKKEEETRDASGKEIEVLFRGHFYESSGYAKVNRNLSINLARQRVHVEIDPISDSNSVLNEIEARTLSFLKRKVGKDYIFIDSVIPTHSKPSNNYNILYTTAEASSVPSQFIDIANSYDEVWVTSEFCKRAFHNSGLEKDIMIVPPIISNLYEESGDSYSLRPKAKSFVFVSVLTWDYRKGYDSLIKSYCSAFSKRDDVSLVLLISERSLSKQKLIKEELSNLAQGQDAPQILFYMKNIPEYQMPSFYRSCNVFVLPSRGEGFGIPFCEASSCGLPVISVNYGGQLDYLDCNNSYLVDIDNLSLAEKGQTGLHYWDGQLFPSLSSEDFINKFGAMMKHVYKNYDEARRKNSVLQKTVRDRFSGSFVANKVKEHLQNIWEKKL